MNEIFKRRLIGLAVLLALVFILSLLLPGNTSRPGAGDVPTTTVALGVLPTPVESSRPSADTGTALHLAPALKPIEPKPEEMKPLESKALSSEAKPTARPSSPAPITKPAIKPSTQPLVAVPHSKSPLPPVTPPPLVSTARPHLVETPVLSKPVVVVPPPAAAVAAAKPAAGAPSAPAQTKPAVGTLWYVQIGSFADTGNAQTTLSLLQNIGYHGESAKITSAGKALFRVRIGPFPTEPVARQALDKVSRQGYPQARIASETRR